MNKYKKHKLRKDLVDIINKICQPFNYNLQDSFIDIDLDFFRRYRNVIMLYGYFSKQSSRVVTLELTYEPISTIIRVGTGGSSYYIKTPKYVDVDNIINQLNE